ncbi:MAG TPA: DUF92 domain-containing protein [Rubrobacteraceae bacterium]|nr:DUF92 domain-containing protein [Rubrobacteraceae bacterium]
MTSVLIGLAYALRMVSRDGALGGFVVALAIYLSLGLPGFLVLALFVLGASALTRLGYQSKKLTGMAEARGGRRGARNALANCGIALLCALLAALVPSDAFRVAFVAALGAAFADTAESEVGQLAQHNPRLITTLQKVPPGTDGAVSVPGTLAGLVTAGLTALFGLWLGLVESPSVALLVAVAAFLGTVTDSFLGALVPRLGNEITNVLCTLVAAALAFIFGETL